MKSLRARVITLLILVGFSAWQLYARGLDLGLDLAGGSRLVLALSDPGAPIPAEELDDGLERSQAALVARAEALGIQEPRVQRVGSDRIVIELAGVEDPERARDVLSRTGRLQFMLARPGSELEQALPAMEQARVAATFAAGAPGIPLSDSTGSAAAASAQRPFRELLLTGDMPGSFLVSTDDVELVRRLLAEPEVASATPRTVSLHWSSGVVAQGARTYRRLHVLEAEPFLGAPRLASASARLDPEQGQSQITYELTSASSRAFEQATTASLGQSYAIVLDGEVVSTPLVQGRLGNRAVIDLGSTPLEQARALAQVLRGGALAAPFTVVADQAVGPAIGRASAARLPLAVGLGLVLVAAVLVGYYRFAGVLALGGLLISIALLLGGLAALDFTVSLAGAAGIVVALALAVDGCVLVFERIRRTQGAGRATRATVEDGFAHATRSMLDSHAVVLIAALVLYQMGSSASRSFALALSVGVVAATLGAVFATRTLFMLHLDRRKPSEPIGI